MASTELKSLPILPSLVSDSSSNTSPRKDSFMKAQHSPRLELPLFPITSGLRFEFSKLKWKMMQWIFCKEPQQILSSVPALLLPEEDELDRSSLDPIFSNISTFKSDEYSLQLTTTLFGPNIEGTLIRKWSNSTCRFWFFLTEERYAFAFESSTTYLVTGHVDGRPFVYTPTFVFDSDDMVESIDPINISSMLSLSLEEVKSLFIDRTQTYLSAFP